MKKENDYAKVITYPPIIALSFFLLSLGLQKYYPLATPEFLETQTIESQALRIGLPIFFFFISSLLIITSLLSMKKAKTNVIPYKPTLAIVTTGVFAYTRNPIYLSFFLIFLGLCLFFKIIWGFLVFIFLYLTFHFGIILREEKYLSEKFGSAYHKYTLKTRRWF